LAILLLLAFHGSYAVARALGIGTPTTRLVAAFAYVLSPRVMSAVGGVSVEVWPMALSPWVLLPLVLGERHGSERRAAAASGLALVLVGGVNAVATAATLPLAAWWLMTRPAGPRRRRLLAWWSVCVLLAVSWWLVPLVTLGRYSPPFLDWIESAAITTGPTSLAETLTGTSHWVAYLSGAHGALWPSGWYLVTKPMAVLFTTLIAGLGLVGLCRPSLPHRRFLVGGVVIGLVLVGWAYTGPLGGGMGYTAQGWLDGALAPLRNVHKFEPVVRLPLVLALAHLLADVRMVPIRGIAWSRDALIVVCIAALSGIAAPAVAGQLPQRGGFEEVPPYWRQAADWLGTHQDGGRALVIPGAPFSVSYWGESRDTPLQPLAQAPWAVRDGVPLSSAGNIRVLNAIEERLADGQGSRGLAMFLADAGVSRLVVRNDLDWPAAGSTRPLLVHQALTQSPGLHEVAFFGPAVGGGRDLPTLTVDQGRDLRFPAIEVYDVTPFRSAVELASTRTLTEVAGSPEGRLDLTDSGLLGEQPVSLSAVPAVSGIPSGEVVVTDSLRRREANFAAVTGNVSATMTADEPYRQRRSVHDWDLSDPSPPKTVAEYVGDINDVRASSAGSNATATQSRGNEFLPFAALDGRTETAWRSGSARGAVGEWLEVRFRAPRALSQVDVLLGGADAAGVTELQVDTDTGRLRAGVDETNQLQSVAVPSGETTRLRITVTRVVAADRLKPVAVRELMIPGVSVQRTLRVPRGPGSTKPAAFAFTVAPGGRNDCAFLGDRPYCAPGLARNGEEDYALDRTFTARMPGTYRLSGTVRARPGPYLDRLLTPLGKAIVATASSRSVADPAGRPQTAVDRDIGSGWVAATGDPRPALSLAWPAKRRVSALRLLSDPALAASRPTEVVVVGGGRTRRLTLDDDGWVRFAPRRMTHLTIRFVTVRRSYSLNPRSGLRTPLPAGVSEVVVPGADALRRGPDLDAATALPCGFAPDIKLDGRRVTTRLVGTLRDVFELRPMRLVPCDGRFAHLSTGDHRLRIDATAEALPVSLNLVPDTWPTATPTVWRQPTVDRWGSVARTLRVPEAATERLLVVHENFNAGWSASLGHRHLRPDRVDGWQQAWLVPAGTGGRIELSYAPDRIFRIGLLIGLLLALALVPLALLRRPGAAPDVAVASRRRTGVLGVAARVALCLAGVWLVAGWLGAGVVGMVWFARRLLPRRRPQPSWLATAAAFALVIFLAVACAAAPWPSSPTGSRTGLAQLLCLGLISLVLTSRSEAPAGAVAEAPESQRGPLDGVPAGRRGTDGQGECHEQDQREPAVEVGAVQQPEGEEDHRHVPQEDPVGHPAQEQRGRRRQQ
jgi:arabinofuranan 3-O-arabinosyltransferase